MVAGKVTSFEVDPDQLQALPRVTVYGAEEYLDSEPEPIRWLVPGLLPLGEATVLAAQGGLGKSYLALQLCIALATGKAFLDFPGQEACGASFFSFEDSKRTLHRRVRAIVQLYREIRDWTPDDDRAMRRNFTTMFVNWSSEGATSFLPDLMPNVHLLLDTYEIRKIRAGLIVIDTLARVSDGDENTVQGLRPVLNACSKLADRDWTPLVLHHVGKGQDGARVKEKPTLAERMSTEWIRGSSSIVDNFRCALQLAKVREDEADPAGLDPEMARQGQVLVFGATKFNGGAKGDWKVIQQDDHGRWAATQESDQILARLRGKKALAALDKQTKILRDLWQATRFGGQPDLAELAKNHYPDHELSKGKNSLKQAIYKMRNAGLIQKNSFVLTLVGLEKMKSQNGGNDA